MNESRSSSAEPPTARKVIFLIPLPDPIPIDHGSTFSYFLEETTDALRGIPISIEEDHEPVPNPDGNVLVSLKFWQRRGDPEDLTADIAAADDVMRAIVPTEYYENREERNVEETAIDDADASDDPFIHAVREAAAELEAGEGGAPETYQTIVEAVTLLLDTDEDPASAAFDRCVDKLANFVRAFRVASRFPVAPITRERLPFSVLALTRDLIGEHGNWGHFLFIAHMNPPVPLMTPGLSAEQLHDLQGHMMAATFAHPLFPLSERAADSELALERYGDTANAVINAQIAAEVLLDTVLMLLLWEEGVSSEDAAEVFADGLAKRVRTQYASRLGGNWAPHARTFERWTEALVRLRGRVVHAAYVPTRTEAAVAIDVVGDLEDFIRQRVAAQRFRYPKTALVVLGEAGLRRRGLWSRRLERQTLDPTGGTDEFVDAYRQWREDLQTARLAL